jgi:hypothetical protein
MTDHGCSRQGPQDSGDVVATSRRRWPAQPHNYPLAGRGAANRRSSEADDRNKYDRIISVRKVHVNWWTSGILFVLDLLVENPDG